MARTVGSTAVATRQQILGAALELFVERGYASTSIRDISERLGMTKGALYYHFSSKEEILHALVDPMSTALDEFTAEAGQAPVDAAMMRRFVDLFDAHRAVVRCILSDPTTVVPLMQRQRVPQRIDALARALTGPADPHAALRAQCLLAVVHAAMLAPGCADGGPPADARPPFRTEPLTDAEKDFTAAVAMAVLDVPAP